MNFMTISTKVCISLVAVFLIQTAALAQYLDFSHDGYERSYLLHLPTGYDGIEPLPLIIAMHGGLGSADNLQSQSGLSNKADSENFIVVYPEGVKGGLLNVRTWNAGWCCGNSSSSNVDDVGFIDALLDNLVDRYAIDTNRIYATGMSNGGFMSYRLACELSDRIAAIAPVSASMSLTGYVPSHPIPIIHFHSYEDSSVPYEGGIGEGVSDHYNSPIDSVLNSWAVINNCHNLNDTLVDNEQYTQVQWSNGDCAAEIQLYITRDGGHSWPGGTQTLIGDPVSEYISANNLMWNFFQQYTLECGVSTSIGEQFDYSDEFEVFPNPTQGTVTVKAPALDAEYHVSVYNQFGKLIGGVQNARSLDLSNHPSGIYYIIIQTEDRKVTKKISIVN